MKALSPVSNCASVNSFHTTNFHHELWNSNGVFPRNISILMYARWSSLVTVPETRTAANSTLCRFQVHIPPETKYTALASRSSPVQLLKWRDRWRYYLRSVANVCISFEITLVYGRETWSVTSREKHWLTVFGNRMLRRISGPKRDQGNGKNCTMKASRSILPTKCYWGDYIKQNPKDGREERCI